MWVYLNGQFVEDARISVFDHGFLYGDGVYETLRVYDGRLLLVDRHLNRLQRSCDLIGLDNPLHAHDYLEIFSESLRRNELKNAVFRLTLSRGEGDWGIDPSLCKKPTVVVMAKPYVPSSMEWRQKGIRLDMVVTRRNPLSAQTPKIKSLSFLNNILAKQEATQSGAHDALMLNVDGFVAECPTSNVFFVANHRVCTPSEACGILEGVTREVVMDLAAEVSIPVEEGLYGPEDILNADECFITNTGLEIMPVTQIGHQPVGDGTVGSITRNLLQQFQKNLPRYLGPNLLED